VYIGKASKDEVWLCKVLRQCGFGKA